MLVYRKILAQSKLKKKFENHLVDLSTDIDTGDNAFEDTISILKHVNCVITSDTAIAHLAGTLNVKTFLLLSLILNGAGTLSININVSTQTCILSNKKNLTTGPVFSMN